MKLTDEQRTAVLGEENTMLVACPGSGKTRTIVAKLLRCVGDVRETARRIACITYTNAAVYEIEDRLRLYGSTGDEELCEVSTIHGFCLNHILRHFHWRLPQYKAGFTVLPPDSERYIDIAKGVCGDYGLTGASTDSFELLNRHPDGQPIVPPDLTADAALGFWDRLRKEALLDFSNIVYLSYRLMIQRPSIARAVASKFAWILVDEFQDTSALQVEILSLIAGENATRFFVVGDPNQSIFRFAGARPDLMDRFAGEIEAQSGDPLLGNFRSSKPVVEHAECILAREPPMVAVGSSARFTEKPVYFHGERTFDAITDYFLPALDELGIDHGEAAILAPWWVKLLHLGRELRDYGVAVVGPGARPYKRVHLFALLAEQIGHYLDNPSPEIIPQVEKELFKLILNATGRPNFGVYSYAGRKTVFRLLSSAKQIVELYEGAVDWLTIAAERFSDILVEDELLPSSCGSLLSESVEDMTRDMEKNKVDLENLGIADLGLFADPSRNLKLLTMHKAKGRECDAVAVVDLHEGKVPHFSAKTAEEIEESRRLLYVAATRARRLLMYFTDEEHWKNKATRFLGELGMTPP